MGIRAAASILAGVLAVSTAWARPVERLVLHEGWSLQSSEKVAVGGEVLS